MPTPTAKPVAMNTYRGILCVNVRSSQNAKVLSSRAVVAAAPEV